jgi:hypothetical protein
MSGGWMGGEKSSFLRLEWGGRSELCDRRANFGLEMELKDGMEVRLMRGIKTCKRREYQISELELTEKGAYKPRIERMGMSCFSYSSSGSTSAFPRASA